MAEDKIYDQYELRPLAHTVTHTTNCAERAKEHRRGNCLLSGALLACGTYHNIIPTLALSKSGYGSKFPTSSQPVTQAPLVINLYVIF